MFKFETNNSLIFDAVKSPLIIRKSELLYKASFLLAGISFLLWGVFTLEPELLNFSPLEFLRLGSLSFFAFLIFRYLNLFFETELKKEDPPQSLEEAVGNIERINYAQYLNYEAALFLKEVIESDQKNSTVLLCKIIKSADFSNFVFSRLLIDKERLVAFLEKLITEEEVDDLSTCLKETITLSLSIAAKRGNKVIMAEDLLVALVDSNDHFRRILIDYDIKKREVESLTSWWVRSKKNEEERKKIWKYENLAKIGSIGKGWSFGLTYTLNRFAVNRTEILRKKGFRKIVGHGKQINSIERILSGDDRNSVMLIGEPGTGRRAVVDELTRISSLGLSLPGVNNKNVFKLNLQSLVAQVEGGEKTEKVLNKVFSEVAQAGNIILVIENIHEYLSGEKRAGVVDISSSLEAFLSVKNFKVVGVTNYKDYRRIVKKRAINSFFSKVELSQISTEKTLELCEMMTVSLESKYDIFISHKALQSVVEYSDKFLASEPFPEKAMNLLEESVIFAAQRDANVLRKRDVAEVVSEKAEVPVGSLDKEEKEKLLNLEDLIHEKIINQEKAVSDIAKSLRRSRSEIDTRKGLIGSFLFLGPTGVGKTETAKAIADIYFGSDKRIIRLDMSEYQNLSDISKLIGSEDREGVLVESVVEDPFSLILLDELEKAHKDILNIFLQILDEGYVTDGVGRKIDFKNCMIIATSNAGYKIILKSIKKEVSLEEVREKILNYVFEEEIFRPEFVNRFDGTVIFEPLSKENLIDIAELQLQDLAKNLKEKHIDFKISKELKEKIVEISYNPVFGAREMQRVIQDKIGDRLASGMLSDKVNPGDQIEISPEDFSIKKIK